MPGDIHWSNVAVLIHAESDSLASGAILNVPSFGILGDVAISTAQFKYGTRSLYFDGSGDCVRFPLNGSFAFGTSTDFTIEAFVRPTAYDSLLAVVFGGGERTGAWDYAFGLMPDGRVSFQMSAAGGEVLTSTATAPLNTWTHVAVTRSGSTIRVFVNGVGVSTTSTLSTEFGGTSYHCIGADNDGAHCNYTGFIDELRVTNGVARYTADFTPPAEAFPTTADTGGGGGSGEVIIGNVDFSWAGQSTYTPPSGNATNFSWSGAVGFAGVSSITLESVSAVSAFVVSGAYGSAITLEDAAGTSTFVVSGGTASFSSTITLEDAAGSATLTLGALATINANSAITLEDAAGVSVATSINGMQSSVQLESATGQAVAVLPVAAGSDVVLDGVESAMAGVVSLAGAFESALEDAQAESQMKVDVVGSADVVLGDAVGSASVTTGTTAQQDATLDDAASSSTFQATGYAGDVTLGDVVSDSTAKVDLVGAMAGALDDVASDSLVFVLVLAESSTSLEDAGATSEALALVQATAGTTLDDAASDGLATVRVRADMATWLEDVQAQMAAASPLVAFNDSQLDDAASFSIVRVGFRRFDKDLSVVTSPPAVIVMTAGSRVTVLEHKAEATVFTRQPQVAATD